MKMQQLEERTGVRREMIRVYFRNGLLPEPAKPKPNVADYGEEHVRSILTIRRLQSEQRLSIAEIKQALSDQAGPLPGDALAIWHLDELVSRRLGVDASLVALSSILSRNPKAEIDAKAMQEVGAIELIQKDGEDFVSRPDAEIISIWGGMRAAGFTEALGFDAELTSIYAERATDLANAEISAFLERVSEFSLDEKADWAQAGLTLMIQLFAILRMKAALKALREAGL
jgi:DNA-binding transcriptional MerR regulator